MFLQKVTTKKKIFVGVSGGVDSSVSLALLQEQGHEVWGVFIRTWQPEWMVCTWREERRDALRVCAHLNVPFLECDLTEEYKTGVAEYMIREYREGRTPNPDVMCNKVVKFGAFYHWARAHGADAIATGHYAQSDKGTLLRGRDEGKDQSYFLWTLTQDQLAHIIFPVGNLEKKDVRVLAEKYQLPTAQKKDSQGICFIGDISMKEFLSHYIAENQGNVLNESGQVIGHHPGALFFTLGERHGFVITEKGTDDRALYVVGKDVAKNILVVGTLNSNEDAPSLDEEGVGGGVIKDLPQLPAVVRPLQRRGASLRSSSEESLFAEPPSMGGGLGGGLISLHSTNDIACIFSAGYTCQCQIRYHGEIKTCEIIDYNPEKNTMMLKLTQSDRTLASGQSIVLYDGEMCLGGGIID